MEQNVSAALTFWGRLKLACRLLFKPAFALQVMNGLRELEEKARLASQPIPPERIHASALFLLGALQREGRLVDFLQQDVAGFSDPEVGAAARVIHGGCRRVLQQYFSFAPAMGDAEGANVAVPKGFDAQRVRLTGNVSGQPPFKGVLKHHGWLTQEVRLPALNEAVDPRVVAPAEVEL